jgi:isopentenyl phosphate kinase
MSKDLTILKLGGSLLTDKEKPYTLRENILNNVTKEIKSCLDGGLIGHIIILHGVGSFGHPPVLENKLHYGFRGPEQLEPLSKTQQIVNKFRLILVDAFQEAEIPVILMHPSSMVVSEKMRMKKYFLEPLKRFMKLGIIPLLGGDLVSDSEMGFSIGSADQLAVILAKELGARRLVFATDVEGIFLSDPKINLDAEIIEEIHIEDIPSILERIGEASKADASGKMKGKLSTLTPLEEEIKQGLQVSIISMMKPGNLKVLLQDGKIKYTSVIS